MHKRPCLSKQGNGRLRKAGKPEMVIIGAPMLKLLQTACGVLKHRQTFNPSLS